MTKTNGTLNKGFIKEKYGKSKQLRFLKGHPLIPVGYIRTKDAKHKKKFVNKYTAKGRVFIHKNLQIDVDILVWLMKHPVINKSIEFADNRISLFSAQYGRCGVTGVKLTPNDIHCYHKIPLEQGGSYSNLILVTEAVHILIHATKEDIIPKYIKELGLTLKQIEKCNKLRKMAELALI